MSAGKTDWCSAKRKIILIRLCSRSSPDRSLSLGVTPWFFAAGLHNLRIDLLYGLMTGWCGKYHFNLSLVCFSLVWSILQTYPALTTANGALLESCLVIFVILGTLVAPLQSWRCSATSLCPHATEVQRRIFHRWIAILAPTSWSLVVHLLIGRWHQNLRRRTWYPTTFSTGWPFYHLQLMLLLWEELLLAVAGSWPPKAQPISEVTAHGAAFSSEFLNSKGWWMS